MSGESQRDPECLFCRILSGGIPSKTVELNDPKLASHVYAFEDVNPQAPHHILIIPRKHIATVDDLHPDEAEVVGELVLAAQEIARSRGVSESGYRLVMNCQEGAGQSVFHIHLHLLGGRAMAWPPG